MSCFGSGLWLPYKKPHFFYTTNFKNMNTYKITKEVNAIDSYTRFFLYVNDTFVAGADTLEDIEETAEIFRKNNGNLINTKTLKEYKC